MRTAAFFRQSLSRTIAVAIAALGAAAGLFLVYLKLFRHGRLPGVLNARGVNDGLMLAGLAVVAGLYIALRPAPAQTAPPRRGRFDRRVLIALVALILAGAFLRFHRLEFQSLWADELFTARRVQTPTLPEALLNGQIESMWPAYHIPLYGYVRLAGDTEFALRFPSALIGVLLIPAAFVLGSRLFGPREGLIAAALVTFSEMQVAFSQEARCYTELMLAAAISGYLWFRIMRALVYGRPLRRFLLLGYAAVGMVLLYLHYLGLVLVGLEGIAALILAIRMRRLPLALVVVYAAIGLTFIPWLPFMIQGLGDTFYMGARLPSSLPAGLFNFAVFIFGTNPVYVLGALCLAAIVIVLAQQRRGTAQTTEPLLLAAGPALTLWLLAPYIIIYFRSLVALPTMQDRYFLVCAPAVYVLIARAVTRLPIRTAGRGVLAIGLAGLLAAQLPLDAYYGAPVKPQMREAVAYVAAHDQQYPGSLIAASFLGGQQDLGYYFRKFGSERNVDVKLSPSAVEESHRLILEKSTRYVWLIGQEYHFDASLVGVLDQDFVQLDEQQYREVGVWLYERK